MVCVLEPHRRGHLDDTLMRARKEGTYRWIRWAGPSECHRLEALEPGCRTFGGDMSALAKRVEGAHFEFESTPIRP